jgi:hypothetical protein
LRGRATSHLTRSGCQEKQPPLQGRPGCRGAHRRGACPADVELPDGVESWSEEARDLLQAAIMNLELADAKDCFRRLRALLRLAKYFALPPVTAKCVGLIGAELERETSGPLDAVWPRATSLRAGFAWSLYFAQRIDEAKAFAAWLLPDLGPGACRWRSSRIGSRSKALRACGQLGGLEREL